MFHRYGEPNKVETTERPKCWGQSYNSEDRECKGCPWQATCRDTVIRSTANRQFQPPQPVQVQTPMNYYQPQYAQPQSQGPVPFQPTKPVPAYNVVPYKPPAPTTIQTPVAIPQPVQQVLQQASLDWYGRFQDPLHFVGTTAPSPYRPQMQGESFFERVAKNIGLAMLEAVTLQSLLAVRQMILPPVPKSQEVDVSPAKRG